MESSSKKTWHLNSAASSLQFVVQLYIERKELLLWSPDRRVSLTLSLSLSARLPPLGQRRRKPRQARYVRHDAAPGGNKPTPVPPESTRRLGGLHPASSTRLSPPSVVNSSRNSGSDSRPGSRFCACAREFLSLRPLSLYLLLRSNT